MAILQTLLPSPKKTGFNRPLVMGVINVTPDSFYEKSRCSLLDEALYKADAMISQGADILDIGGESTSKMVQRFGYDNQDRHQYVAGDDAFAIGDSASAAQQLERVSPVIKAIKERFDCLVSVDTSEALVIAELPSLKADILNDIRALRRPGALQAAAKTELPIILMHSLVDHPLPGVETFYPDVVDSVKKYLKQAIIRCEKAGISRKRLILDPGFGAGLFGKSVADDLALLTQFESLKDLQLPLLAGISRKSFIGSLLNKGPDMRLYGTLAATVLLVQKGADILRVHDVEATVDVLKVLAGCDQGVIN